MLHDLLTGAEGLAEELEALGAAARGPSVRAGECLLRLPWASSSPALRQLAAAQAEGRVRVAVVRSEGRLYVEIRACQPCTREPISSEEPGSRVGAWSLWSDDRWPP